MQAVKNFLINFLAILFFISNITSAQKNEKGVYVPADFKTINTNNLPKLNKKNDDTLDYKTFSIIKEDFLLNNGCGDYGSNQYYANIARDEDGGYLCVWIDDKSGLQEINAQLFDKNDLREGKIIRVSENYFYWNPAPFISFNKVSSEYIITWAESDGNIHAQRISKSGEKTGGNFFINQFARTNSNYPSICCAENGKILVCWYSDKDYIGGQSILLYRIFNSDLTPVIDQKEIFNPSNENTSSLGFQNTVSSDSSGNFFIVWSSYKNNHSRIFLQKIDSNGDLIDHNLVVSDSSSTIDFTFPTIASTRDGYFFIVWAEKGAYARIYNINSGFVTPQFTIEEEQSYSSYYAVTSDDNNFYVAFSGEKRFSQIISKDGQNFGEKKELSFSLSKLTKVKNKNFYSAFTKFNKDDADAMVQKFDLEFNPAGKSIKASDDYCSSEQKNPVVKYNESGRSISAWEDRRNGITQIYAQVLDENGNALSENILVNDTSIFEKGINPEVLSDKSGNFYVIFSGGEYYFNVIVQKISKDGNKIGSNNKLTDINYADNLWTHSQINDNDDLLICWQASYSNSAIYFQKFHPDFTPYNNYSKLFYTPSAVIQDISINKNFEILIMWTDYFIETGIYGKDLKGMLFNPEGSSISDSIVVYSGDRIFLNAACKLDIYKNLAFIWTDCNSYGYDNKINLKRIYSGGKNCFDSFAANSSLSNLRIIKIFNKNIFAAWSDNNKINAIMIDDNKGIVIPINLYNYETFFYTDWGIYNNNFDLDIYNNRVLLCFESIKNVDKGYDIYANIQMIDSSFYHFPISDDANYETISSVYPNPISTNVSLNYFLTIPVKVSVSVYNILGERIAVIEDKPEEPGFHTIKFNASNLPSGIYFLYYKGLKSFARKFLIVK